MKVKFYQKSNGKQPVVAFLDKLPVDENARIAACLSNVEKLGFDCPRVVFRQIKASLWEIKIKTIEVDIDFFMYALKTKILCYYMLTKNNHKKHQKRKLNLLKNVCLRYLKMKALTLTNYLDKKLKSDKKFAEHYAREQIINNIAEMIVEARKTAHLTQSELAKKVGTTQSVISRIESGNSVWIPSLETLMRIASALKLKLQLQMQ